MASESTVESFLAHSGAYQTTLYISALDSVPLAYDLGIVTFEFPIKVTLSIKPSIQESFIPQPEIHHVFRAPDKQAPRWLSGVFTLMVVAPWTFLLTAASVYYFSILF